MMGFTWILVVLALFVVIFVEPDSESSNKPKPRS